MPATYDEKDDMESLKATLQRRKKSIYIGLAILSLIVACVCIGISTSSSSSASTESAQDTPASATKDTPASASEDTAASATKDNQASAKKDTQASAKKDTQASESDDALMSTLEDAAQTDQVTQVDLNEATVRQKSSSISKRKKRRRSASKSPIQETDETTIDQISLWNSTDGVSVSFNPSTAQNPSQSQLEEILAYSLVDFDWTDASKWEYTSGAALPPDMVTSSGITLTPDNSAEPIRTIEGWSGEKVVYVEWERTSTSDTNIWMLNTKLQSQFGKGNGWPYWGELDLFEMFTQDAISIPAYDFSGFGPFTDASSYGQLTMHMGPPTEDGSPCFCPASPDKSLWYQNTRPMTSGCTAQFSNDKTNSIAAVWGSDSTGKYIQLIQKPTLKKGGKLMGADTYDVTAGSGVVTPKIYNNAELFWGADARQSCAQAGGHNAATGFPFFESFRLVLEEQKKGDSTASFTLKNMQVFTKN